MEKILNYTIIENIAHTKKSIIYRAKKENEDKNVIIKVLNTDSPSPSEIARFKQEYELIKNLDFPGIVKVFEIIQDDNGFAMVEEDFNGISLKKFLNNKRMELHSFLKTAIKLSNILGNIHKHNIVHKDIKPHNIIINSTKGIVKITDFGISNELTHKNEEFYNPDIIEGTLPYMSPEQTGRMNRAVDYRTDLYSLGITFYEMLLGKVPFEAKDPMEIIHAHIAKEPIKPIIINPAIPEIISRIIMKLLSKNAEERYQNCFGLMEDLKECLNQFDNKGEIINFEMGLKDISMKFNIPQIIFGREREIDVLMKTFERVASLDKGENRRIEVMLISGNPGIGKSALVNEIHKPIIAKRGYFISGKYDQFRRDIPYSAIIQAFTGLIKQILTESDERIKKWKEKILEAVGSNGKIITDVITGAEYIIGKQKEVPELGPEQSLHRFNLVLKNFVTVFAHKEHPLVLFLDDLQWADLESLSLVKTIITDPDINYLFLICSYRDNEMSDSHPFMRTVEEIKKEGININSIMVMPLSIMSVKKLVANFLRCKIDTSLPLAELIYKKTHGNPFFVNQFLKTLYDENILQLNPAVGWTWNNDMIKNLQVTDNVVDLMVSNIKKLPQMTVEILEVCACIGNRFEIMTLSYIVDKTIDETVMLLARAIDEGLIFLHGDIYKFYHDRIHEAAYSLISDDKKQRLHYKIGNHLLKNSNTEELTDKILYIVDQLNAGKNFITSDDDKVQLAQLNLMAGKKSKSSAAYQSALYYLKEGVDLLGENSWQNMYAFTLDLYNEAAEAAYLNAEFDLMENLAAVVFTNSKILLDKIKIYELKIQSYYAQNRLMDAIREALKVLWLLGNRFPSNPNNLHILWYLLKTKFVLFGKKIDELKNMKDMNDPIALAEFHIIEQVGHAAYYALPKLTALIGFQAVLLSLKYGIAPESAFGFTAYGMILCGILGNIDNGYRFGQLASFLKERPDSKKYKARTGVVIEATIHHWKDHLKESLQPLLDMYTLGLEIGDMEYATLAVHIYSYHLFFCGKSLMELNREMSIHTKFIRQKKQETNLNYQLIFYQSFLNLMTQNQKPWELTGDLYNEKEMLPIHKTANDGTAIFDLNLMKTIINFMFERDEAAVECANICIKNLKYVIGLILVPIFYFYDSMSRLATINKTARRKKINLRRIKANQKKMKKWSLYAPMNHLHKYFLVEAEIASLENNDLKAMDLYDKAILGARSAGYIQEEAIANERAALFYLACGKNSIAQTYMSLAYNGYYKWGSMAKLKHLEDTYPHLLVSISLFKKKTVETFDNTETNTTSTVSTAKTLDLFTVIKSSQALSSEIDLKKLLETIMKISIANAGAQKGFLILKNEENKNLYIEAESSIDRNMELLKSIPIESSTNLSVAIVSYVNKTMEPVVLNNACTEGIFTTDKYIIKNRPKSILCAPIIYKGKSSGLIYLENNLTTNAFTQDRLELLQILSSQAAISIENARLLVHRESAAKLQMEMQIAERIQTSLLPKSPQIKGLEICAYMNTADKIGGDYYDIIHAANRDWIVIGDVSGHGVPAGLVMMMVQTSIQTILKKHPDLPPSELLNTINDIILENINKLGEDKYVTITILSYQENGKFIFSGLHQNIMIYREEKKELEIVPTDGIWIGIMKDIKEKLKDDIIQLHIGDTILLYTDGITEAWKKGSIKNQRNHDDMFGENRLKDVFLSFGNKSPEEIKNGIIEGLQDYEHVDDVTLVVLRRIE